MQRDLAVTVDVGTTALKVAIWDRRVARPLASYTEEYPLQTRGDEVECDPQAYLDAITRGVRTIAREDGLGPRVAALAFTTQGETFTVVDSANRPVRPAIVWLDSRAEAEARQLHSRLDAEEFRRTTGLPAITGATPLAKALHLSRSGEGVAPKGGALLLVEDFLVAQLTGRRVTNASMQTSTGWFDILTDDYWDQALQAAGLSRAELPEVIASGSVIASVLPVWADRLGLPDGVMVVAGGMDQCAAAVGAGANGPDVASVTFGSALTVVAPLRTPPAAPGASLTIYRHVVAQSYLALEFLPTGAILLAWLRRILSEPSGGVVDYRQLDELAERIPIGSDGVVALPQFEGDLAGTADTRASGGFLGLTLTTTAGHLARSLMESTAYVLKDALNEFERHGIRASRVLASGGGSRSTTWQRIASDVCGRRFERLEIEESTSRGAALLAHWGVGAIPFGLDPTPPRFEIISPDIRHAEPYRRAEQRFRTALVAARQFWSAEQNSATASARVDQERTRP